MSDFTLSLPNLALCHVRKSTVQQLLLFMHNIFNSCQTDAIYLEAFNTVSHVHLLDKLASVDIAGDLWFWFWAYLTNTIQYVSFNNITLNFTCGVWGAPG